MTTRIYAGINYIRQNGTSKASEFKKKWEAEHPEYEEFDGDLRCYPEYRNYEKVYLMTYNYHFHGSWFPEKHPTVYSKYIKFERENQTKGE